MSEAKDTAIKLFGKTIPLREISAGSRNEHSRTSDSASGVEEKCASTQNSSLENTDGEEREVNKDTFEGKITKATQKGVPSQTSELCAAQDSMTETNGNPKTPSIDTETTKSKASRNEEDNQSDTTSGSEEKTLKKPDKIIPCPRCNSMDTKFCYYNNYNVNQPRHFCKNCQRYWTAGGTMRNVAVGAGRRKNKNSTSHFPHITIPESLQIPQNDVSNFVHHPSVNPNGLVSNIAEKTIQDCKKEEEIRNCHNVSPQATCFPGAPWTAYPWISAQWSPSGYPMPLYWGCAVPGNWNIPEYPFASSGQNMCLGKHPRDDDVQIKPINSERCLWTPKTLRIDDPGEAAKSSIWETLGIKNEMVGSIGGRGLFKAFQSKGDVKNHVVKSSPALQANPAALCRSVNFHESS